MGLGDNLMATGMARGAAKRGKRIAFGDGKKIRWDQNSERIFRHNPNIAPPGHERAKNIEWLPFYRGSRLYNKQSGNRWIWNYEFHAKPGEMFFQADEERTAQTTGRGFVVVEPNVPMWKSCAPNKQWPVVRYEEVAKALRAAGLEVVQLIHDRAAHRLRHVRYIGTPNFRIALATLARAALYVGPEGGLHHGAAAVAVPAVVLFGGFVPPQVTGYDAHVNLTGGAEACGSLTPCEHCRAAMAAIPVEEVLEAARAKLAAVAA